MSVIFGQYSTWGQVECVLPLACSKSLVSEGVHQHTRPKAMRHNQQLVTFSEDMCFKTCGVGLNLGVTRPTVLHCQAPLSTRL